MPSPVSLLLALALHAAPAAPAQPVELKGRPFALSAIPEFQSARRVLEKLLVAQRVRGKQRFCVFGQDFGDRGKQAWVYWETRRTLIEWHPVVSGVADLYSARWLRLETDVVSTEDEIRGSTYLVTQAWWKEQVAQCRAVGVVMEVQAPPTLTTAKRRAPFVERAHAAHQQAVGRMTRVRLAEGGEALLLEGEVRSVRLSSSDDEVRIEREFFYEKGEVYRVVEKVTAKGETRGQRHQYDYVAGRAIRWRDGDVEAPRDGLFLLKTDDALVRADAALRLARASLSAARE